MPVFQNHFWLLVALEAGADEEAAVTDKQRKKAWATPCCGRLWRHADGWSKRCFSLLFRDGQGKQHS
eukprot:490373-Lingulodinium_polyedra.AAC.1